MKHGVAPRRSLASKTLAMALLVMLVGAWLAPVAHAQVGGIGGAVGDIGGAVGDIGGAVGDIGGAVGGGGDTAGGTGATDTGGGLVGGVTDGLGGATSASGSDSTGTGGGDPVGGVIDAVSGTVDSTKDQADETAGDVGGSLGQVGSGAGGTVGTVKDTLDRTTDGLTGTGGHKKKGEDARSPDRRTGSMSPSSVETGTEVLGASMADALRADGMILAAAKTEDNDYTATGSSSAGQSFIDQIGRVAAEAAQQAAFPIALILMVAAFLMVQNRIDSKDPKLALAPVDSEHDLLSFT